MKTNEVKKALQETKRLEFRLPNGTIVPEHFHVTEVGIASKTFIDCGGTVRVENKVNFQLWTAEDFDHRLAPQKLLHIIELAEDTLLSFDDLEVEVEYQSDTIGKYGLELSEHGFFQLTSKNTDCLAKDKCGITVGVSSRGVGECCSESGCC